MSVEHIILDLVRFNIDPNPSEEVLAQRLPAGSYEDEARGILDISKRRKSMRMNDVMNVLAELHCNERKQLKGCEGPYNTLYIPFSNEHASYAIEVWRNSTRPARLEFSFGPRYVVVEKFINHSRQQDYYAKVMKDLARIGRETYITTIYFLPDYIEEGALRQPET